MEQGLLKTEQTCYYPSNGGVAERSKAAVLKTVDGQLSVGSNPTSSVLGRAHWNVGKAIFLCNGRTITVCE